MSHQWGCVGVSNYKCGITKMSYSVPLLANIG